MYSQIFKPITTALRQVAMKKIACTIERIEMLISINIADRAEAMLIIRIAAWKGGRAGI